jgi:hypothetical protein
LEYRLGYETIEHLGELEATYKVSELIRGTQRRPNSWAAARSRSNSG